MRSILLVIVAAISGRAQAVSFGVRAGIPLTNVLDAAEGAKTSYRSVTNRYLIGPTLEIRLPFSLSLEVDALYRHFRYDSAGGLFGAAYGSSRAVGNDWEVPLLAKRRFRTGAARPYLDAGIAWDIVSGHSTGSNTVTAPYQNVPPTTVATSGGIGADQGVVAGLVLGGGLEVHASVLRIAPEVRYTRWLSQHFTQSGFEYGTLASRQNQIEFLVGITF